MLPLLLRGRGRSGRLTIGLQQREGTSTYGTRLEAHLSDPTDTEPGLGAVGLGDPSIHGAVGPTHKESVAPAERTKGE